VYHDHFGQLSLSVELGILSLQRVRLVILNVVGNSENSHRCTALIKHPVRKAIVMLSCDQSSSVLHQFRVNHISNQFLNPELVLFSLAQTL
jgi:hypothetical protein